MSQVQPPLLPGGNFLPRPGRFFGRVPISLGIIALYIQICCHIQGRGQTYLAQMKTLLTEHCFCRPTFLCKCACTCLLAFLHFSPPKYIISINVNLFSKNHSAQLVGPSCWGKLARRQFILFSNFDCFIFLCNWIL